LPRIRDQLRSFLSSPDSPLRLRTLERDHPAHDQLSRHLAGDDLHWVTPEMCAQAVGSAQRLDRVRWIREDRPAASGLIVFDGGISTIDYFRYEMPIDAMSWGPDPDGVRVGLYVGRWRLNDLAGAVVADPDSFPPLVLLDSTVQPVHADPSPVDDIGLYQTPLTSLMTAWSLMRQPQLIERQPVVVDRQIRRAYTRAGRPEPEVRLITLRRVYRPEQGPPLESDQPGRHYRHRWYVPEFPRWQRKGPGLSQVELITVTGHHRGPKDAPLLTADRVNVWRR
jgi:hypothetical protein